MEPAILPASRSADKGAAGRAPPARAERAFDLALQRVQFSMFVRVR